jgi:hypothetical protein
MKTQALCTGDELEWSQTHPIIRFWSTLRQANFSGDVDALLPEPKKKEEMYVFFGVMTQTVKIDTTSGQRFLSQLYCAYVAVLTTLTPHRDL